jgi:hypothetical protein
LEIFICELFECVNLDRAELTKLRVKLRRDLQPSEPEEMRRHSGAHWHPVVVAGHHLADQHWLN